MKNQTRAPLAIYLRLILPLASYLIFIIVSLIPCIRFTLDSDPRQSMSLFGLIGNSWSSARQYLFSSKITPTNDGTLFYKIIFAVIIVCVTLFLLALAADIFSTAAYRICTGKKAAKATADHLRALYLALIPNRAVLCILRILALPLLLLPFTVTYLYHKILFYSVDVNIGAAIPAAIALALIIASAVITAIANSKKRITELKKRLNFLAIIKLLRCRL